MTKLNVTQFGKGPETALFVHCSLAHGGVWKSVVGPLADRVTGFAPDMPGHGRSVPWDGQGDVHDAVTEGVRPLIGDACHLVGHSFGATVALRLALEAPDKVLSLTMIEPVLFAAAKNTPAYETYRDLMRPYLEARDAEDWSAMALAFYGAWGGGASWESVPKSAQQAIVGLMPMVAASEASLTEDSCGLLTEGRLENLSMPVTFLRGGQSQPVMEQIHANLMSRIPQAHEVVVEEAGHMLPISHPAPVSEALAAHLTAVTTV